MYLINNINIYCISFTLALGMSQQISAQVSECSLNNQCDNITGGYIDRSEVSGTLTLDHVYLNGIRQPWHTLDPNFAPIVISLGVKNGGQTNLGLDATALTIDTISPYVNDHARAIAVGSNSYGETMVVSLQDSDIKLVNNSANKNTIGVLLESDTSGQIYKINLKDTKVDISSSAGNNTVGALWTYSGNGFKETNIILEGSHLYSTSVAGVAYGIRTEDKSNSQLSSVYIGSDTSSAIVVTGSGAAYGIGLDTRAKNATIDNGAAILVTGTSSSSSAYGIRTLANTSNINTSGNINVSGGSAYGIYASGTLDQNINSASAINITATGTYGKAIGIFAESTSSAGSNTVYSAGDIKVDGYNSIGIQSNTQADSMVTVVGDIESKGQGSTAVSTNVRSGQNTIHVLSGASLKGGSSSGATGILAINVSGEQLIILDDGSEVSSLNDMAIDSRNSGSGSSKSVVENSGRVIGVVSMVGMNTEFNNHSTGILDLQYFPQGSKQDIVNSIGTGTGTFNNAGLIKFSDKNFNGQATNALFDVGLFTNSGVIDLTGKNPLGLNTSVGDTFKIQGDYQSEGGSIYLNTLVDDASSNGGLGISDLFIVDGDVTTGTGGSTKLYIIPTSDSSLGTITVGNGIKVIDVSGTSSSDAFILGGPLTSGLYEYQLNQGVNDSNWYIANTISNKGLNSSVMYNPSIGAYLANQTAALQMFQQTLFDRYTAASEVSGDASKPLLWLRTFISHASYDSFHANFSNRTRTYSAQLGGDISVWKLSDGGYFHLGLMAGYGDFKATSRSRLTTTKAEANMKGYSAGIYGTYFADQDVNRGFYADLWSQMGWYRNEVSGKSQRGQQKYNSSIWSNSIELGYGIPLVKSGDYQWLVTPQLQLTYNHYDADSLQDKNQLRLSNNDASGLDSRVGFRIHARGIEKKLIEPFLELNWLSSTAKNEITFNGKTIRDGFSRDRLEAKIGLQGNLSERISTSVQFGGQWGNANSYKAYQGQLNIMYKF